jgi:hypothetical protein
MNFLKKRICLSLIFFNFSLFAELQKIEQIKIGNFALPASQQPGPLVSFGQNMLDQHDLQFFAFIDQISGDNKQFTRVIPTILYGIRDNFSLYIELPIVKFQLNDKSSQGVQYVLTQLEYAFYNNVAQELTQQITAVLNMTFPISSHCQLPAIGFGAPSLFVGFTASRMSPSWYYFVSSGATIPAEHEKTKFGNQYLYQAGVSKNIASTSEKLTLNLTLEFDGIYAERNMIAGIINRNSGGNTMTLGPSIWVSTPRWIFQGGIAWYVYQNLFGVQNKNNYYIAVDIGYKF